MIKLVRHEPESEAVSALASRARLASSELVMVEIPRALRRIAAIAPDVDSRASLREAEALLGEVALHPLRRPGLVLAGSVSGPFLRSLDAIHVASALELRPLDAFLTYDKRQAQAAAEVGLSVLSPGA